MAEQGLASLYDWLLKVQQRPGMYVRDWSLEELERMCHGYSVALSIYHIEEFGTCFNQRFGGYLFNQYGWSQARGWARAIREESRGPEEAFHRFFALIGEFKQHLTKDRP